MAGLANYNGEIQPSRLTFNQSNGAVAAGATLDITNKLLLRGEYNFTRLGADDKNSIYKTRNLNFKTLIQELDLMAEYNFWDMTEKRITPYVFGGVGIFKFSPYTTDSVYGKVYLQPLSTEGQGLPQYPTRKVYKTVQFNVPIGGGIKYAISDDVQFGFEYGLRVLFTDYLDDVSTRYIDENTLLNARGPIAVAVAYRGDEIKTSPRPYPNNGSLRGSEKSKDYYYYGLARLSIRMNWFENGVNFSGSRRNRMGCPRNVL
jgi:hypothetical protein